MCESTYAQNFLITKSGRGWNYSEYIFDIYLIILSCIFLQCKKPLSNTKHYKTKFCISSYNSYKVLCFLFFFNPHKLHFTSLSAYSTLSKCNLKFKVPSIGVAGRGRAEGDQLAPFPGAEM